MDALPHQELLVVLAEVAVAMAGFAGIIATIGRSGQDLQERQEVRVLVVGAAYVLLLSLMPLLLSAAPIEDTSVWRISSGVSVVFGLAYYLVTPREAFRLILATRLYKVFIPGDIVMFLGLVLVASGFAGDRYSGLVYLGSLFWMLLQVVTFFIRAASPLWNAPD